MSFFYALLGCVQSESVVHRFATDCVSSRRSATDFQIRFLLFGGRWAAGHQITSDI